MAKNLTTSRIDRQNILNNEIAVEETKNKSGVESVLWEGKVFITREMTADFFKVDIRTIHRYIEQNNDELDANGYVALKGKKLLKLFHYCILISGFLRSFTHIFTATDHKQDINKK